MYEMRKHSSKTSVTDIFPLEAIKERKYIEESTECPPVRILRCEVRNIELNMYKDDRKRESYRCKIFPDLVFPPTAQNRESLRRDLADCEPENRLLVLLGL